MWFVLELMGSCGSCSADKVMQAHVPQKQINIYPPPYSPIKKTSESFSMSMSVKKAAAYDNSLGPGQGRYSDKILKNHSYLEAVEEAKGWWFGFNKWLLGHNFTLSSVTEDIKNLISLNQHKESKEVKGDIWVNDCYKYFRFIELGIIPEKPLEKRDLEMIRLIDNNQRYQTYDTLMMANREHINAVLNESQQIWLEEKLQEAVHYIPKSIIDDGGYSKFLKIIIGMLFYKLDTIDITLSKRILQEEFFKSLQGGYYFGLTYPLVDDVMDSNEIIDQTEKKTIVHHILHGLSSGKLFDKLPTHPLAFILKTIFENLNRLYPFESNRDIYTSLLIFATAQTIDQNHSLDHITSYNEIIIPTIIKSAYTRLTVKRMANHMKSGVEHTLMLALYNQMEDDLADFEKDLKNGAITSFTYYFKAEKNDGNYHT